MKEKIITWLKDNWIIVVKYFIYWSIVIFLFNMMFTNDGGFLLAVIGFFATWYWLGKLMFPEKYKTNPFNK